MKLLPFVNNLRTGLHNRYINSNQNCFCSIHLICMGGEKKYDTKNIYTSKSSTRVTIQYSGDVVCTQSDRKINIVSGCVDWLYRFPCLQNIVVAQNAFVVVGTYVCMYIRAKLNWADGSAPSGWLSPTRGQSTDESERSGRIRSNSEKYL